MLDFPDRVEQGGLHGIQLFSREKAVTDQAERNQQRDADHQIHVPGFFDPEHVVTLLGLNITAEVLSGLRRSRRLSGALPFPTIYRLTCFHSNNQSSNILAIVRFLAVPYSNLWPWDKILQLLD